MKEKKQETVVILNQLLDSCQDSEYGFLEAAGDVREKGLREMFLGFAIQMKQFGKAIQDEVAKLGGTPHLKGTATGALHRSLIHMRSMVNLHNPEVVLMECEKGEEAALKRYEEALDFADLPADIKEMLGDQVAVMAEMRNKIREMESHKEEAAEPKDQIFL